MSKVSQDVNVYDQNFSSKTFAATSVEEKKILSGSTIETIVLGTLTQDFAFEQERLVTSKNAASHVSRYELASSN